MPGRAEYSVTPEQLAAFVYSEQPISVSELTKRLNDLVNPLYVKELKRGVITDWLTEIGMLSDYIVNNKTRKRPTAQGMNIGIITEERCNQYGTPYEGVFYNLNAQHFIIDNIGTIIEQKLQKSSK